MTTRAQLRYSIGSLWSLLVASCVLFGCGSAQDEQLVGTLERDRLELIAEANEPIVEIAHHEGEFVTAGTAIVRLDLGAMRARLEEAQAAQRVAERRLAELVGGARAQEIVEARAALASAQSLRDTDEREYRRVADLVLQQLVSQSALDQTRSRRDASQAAYRQAAARLDLLLEGTRREQLEQAEAMLKQTQAALAQLQTSAERYVVRAPRNGRIEALPYELGERPPAGAPLVVLAAEGAPYARVYVPEPRRLQFAPGQQVAIAVDGSDTRHAGVVRFIASQAAFTPYYALTQEDRSSLSYLAEIDLVDEEARGLPSGIPVQVSLTPKSEP